MFKIRWKKKDRQTQPADPTKSIAHSVLKAALLHRHWQETLVQCAMAVPNQRAALAPLIVATLTPSLAVLIEHAREHKLITAQEAMDLTNGHVGTFDLRLKEVAHG